MWAGGKSPQHKEEQTTGHGDGKGSEGGVGMGRGVKGGGVGIGRGVKGGAGGGTNFSNTTGWEPSHRRGGNNCHTSKGEKKE